MRSRISRGIDSRDGLFDGAMADKLGALLDSLLLDIESGEELEGPRVRELGNLLKCQEKLLEAPLQSLSRKEGTRLKFRDRGEI